MQCILIKSIKITVAFQKFHVMNLMKRTHQGHPEKWESEKRNGNAVNEWNWFFTFYALLLGAAEIFHILHYGVWIATARRSKLCGSVCALCRCTKWGLMRTKCSQCKYSIFNEMKSHDSPKWNACMNVKNLLKIIQRGEEKRRFFFDKFAAIWYWMCFQMNFLLCCREK